MMRPALAAALALTLASCAGSQGERPMHEMQGGCGDYRLDVTREIALAQSAGVTLQAAAGAQPDAAFVPLEQRVAVNLLPQTEVKFRLPPERRREATERHAGMLQLRVASDGDYRISTGTAAWVDVIDAEGNRLRPQMFEMQTQCASVFKTVVFALRGGTNYTMQVSASRAAVLPMFVVRHAS